MKLHRSKQKTMHLAALVAGSLLCASTAGAADLIVTIPSNYADSELGTINGSRVTTHIDAAPRKAVMQGLGGDFTPFNYHQQGKSMLFARRYTYSTTNPPPAPFPYSPGGGKPPTPTTSGASMSGATSTSSTCW